jgi:penicillin-binding protein 2
MRNFRIQKKQLSRRTFVLGGIHCSLSALLMGRLLQLQTSKAETYATMAEDNRINLQLIVPERGVIVDRFGSPIAENRTNYQLMLDKSQLKVRHELFAKLQPLLKSAYPLEEVLQKQMRRNPHNATILLKENLDWDELSAIEFNAPTLAGITVETGTMRYYPFGSHASHLLGYVGTASPEEAKNNRLLSMPGFKIGKAGLEKREETALHGTAGLRHMEVNASGQYLKEVSRRESVTGEKVRCTIIAELHAYIAERLGKESGSVVAIDVETGDVLALASLPAFDPNLFSKGITQAYWDELMADKKTPLMNKSIAGQYPPGSTFKMMVGLKGLEEGVIAPESHIYCPGYFYLGNHRFRCWKPGGHGHMNYESAIVQSCDTFFYTVGRKIGIEKIADVCHEYGLGQTYNLGLVGEKKGIVPSTAWKRASYNQPWQAGDTVNVSIGQGYVLATPFQLAIMAARLATGRKVMPRLTLDEPHTPFEELSTSKESLAVAQLGMINVCASQRGTAYGARITEAGFEMAGKTGTSQVRRITIAGQDQSRLPWEQRHHALFVAFAPVAKPRYALSVMIEHGGGGASVAAPIARDVMLKLQQIMAQREKRGGKE